MGFSSKQNKAGISEAQVRIAGRIASGLLAVQRRLADRINGRVRQIPVAVQLILLVAFGLGFGIYCGYLLLRAFF